MPRQARSEATRRRIVDAAVDLIGEIGYPAVGLGDIIERAALTKGALYYHFDSKESLAVAIIAEGGANLLATFHSISESNSPALENIIHGLFMVVDRVSTDPLTRTAAQLLRVFGGFSEVSRQVYAGWLAEMVGEVRRASTEGDLREGLDPGAVAETIVCAMLGAELLSGVDDDLRNRLTRMWQVLLPAVVADESLDYFREFLAREALRAPSPPAD
ncbi:TetR family transcriptional regulator [Mycobacterium sp. NPDC050041]|jgi:AcrR family transcriptional regulator|uniref:TetR family transcriptional regulator n=1 Tax=Mycobacterium sp. NPDC050041 TaxID=3364293 RepID=UPI003C2CB7E0